MITRNKAIVVLNAGSSSLKFSVYEASSSTLTLVTRGQIEGIGSVPRFEATDDQGAVVADEKDLSREQTFGHNEAFAYLARWLQAQHGEQMAVAAVGHRITHGGLEISEPTLIDADTLARLERLAPLAPAPPSTQSGGGEGGKQVATGSSAGGLF